MKNKTSRLDLIFRNSGKAAAQRTQKIAFDVARANRSNARDEGVPPLMSTEGSALAKNTAPRSAYEVVGIDDRQRMSLDDGDPRIWRQFRPGDDPSSIAPDPLSALIAESEQSDEDEEPEFSDEEPEEEAIRENAELSQARNAFDRTRLLRAIDRLTKRTTKHFTKGRDGRSVAMDDGRTFTTTHGCIGGIDQWNRLFAAGEIS